MIPSNGSRDSKFLRNSTPSQDLSTPPSVALPVKPGSASDNNNQPIGLEKEVKHNVDNEASQKVTAAASPLIIAKKSAASKNWVSQLVEYTTKKTLKVVKKDYNFQHINAISQHQLLAATGNPQFALALTAVVPKLTEIILSAITEELDTSKKFYADGVKATLQGEEELIADCLNATLLKMMAREALNTQNSIQKNPDSKITFSDMIAHLLGITENLFQDLHNKITQIKETPEKKLRNQQIDALQAPIKRKILETLLPNGAEDIVVPDGLIMKKIRILIYEALEDALPNLIIENYQAVMDLTLKYSSQDKAALRELPGGNVLVALTEALVKKLRQNVPDLLKDNILPLVQELSPKFFSTAENDPEKLNSWLAESLEQVITSKNPETQTLLNFGEFYLTPMVEHIFLNMAEKSKDDDPNNVLSAITKHLLVTFTAFFENNRKTIDPIVEQLRKAPNVQEKKRLESELIKLFEPLSNEIINLTGLDKPNELPLPTFLRGVVTNVIKQQIPIRLARLYDDLNPEQKANAPNQQKFSTFTDVLIRNMMPAILKKTQLIAPEALVEVLSLEEFIDENTAKQFMSSFMEELITGSSANKVRGYLNDYLHQILTNGLIKLAPDDSLPNLLVQTITLSKKTLLEIDHDGNLLTRINNFKKLSDEQQEIEKKELIQKCIPLSDELLKLMGFSTAENLPGPTELRPLFFNLLKNKLVPWLLLETFQGVNQPYTIQEDYRLQLHQLMGKDIAKDDNRLLLERETHPFEVMFGFFAEKITGELKITLIDESGELFQSINNQLPNAKLSESDQAWLGGIFKTIATSDDPGIKDLWKYTTDVLKSVLMKLFVDSANPLSGTVDPKNAKAALIPNMLKSIVDILRNNLDGIQAKIKEINSNLINEDDRKLEMRKLFAPLSEEFFILAGPDAFAALPIPDVFKKPLLEILQQKILPDLISKTYRDIIKWQLDTQTDQDALIKLFNNENPKIAAKVISRFASEILPAIVSDSKKVNEKILKIFAKFMHKQPEESAQVIYDYMVTNPDAMKALLKDNFAQLLDPDLNMREGVLPAIDEFLETSILKGMSAVFTKIAERQNPDFMMNIGLEMLDITNQHFAEINRIMKKEKKNSPSKVAPEIMRQNFENLHSAISGDLKLSPEKQEKLLRKNLLRPLTEQVLKLAGIESSADLPLPSASEELREKLFEIVKKDLGPLIMESLMDSIHIDKVLISVLELVNAGVESPLEVLPPEFEHDPNLQAMNKACGNLLLNMVRLIPNTGIRALFENEKIRKLPAEALGKIVRGQLLKTNLLQLIDKGLLAGLPILHKQITSENGKLVVPEELHFKFPETDAVRAEEKTKRAEEKIRMEKKFVDELSRTLRKQIVLKMKNFLKTHWRKLQKKLDDWIQNNFGENAQKVKRILDKIFHVIVFNILGTIFQIFAYPFIKLSGFILNIHLRRKSQQISDTIHIEIHKNLVYKLAEMTLTAINKAPGMI